MAASADTITDDGNHTVELTVLDNEESAANGGSAAASSEEITPLLTQIERPKINIFSVSRSRRKPRELVIKAPETEISPVSQFMLWAWSGSRYSGLLCMALSSVIYFVMEVLSENFTAQSIPLFETSFVRCTVTLILSYIWLRRIGLPIFGATHPRKLLLLRSLVGYLSLLSFIYCIQRIPFSLAILLSFTTPIMASIMARIFLHEKLKITEIGGLACSFSGMLFIFQQMLTTQGGLQKTEEASNSSCGGSNHIYAALIGFFSSITGGISYCLIKAAAKATDQPVVTVLSFAILASPAAGICTFAFEEFVLPSFNSLSLMLALGILSFLAEVFLAHGLQLEKINKAANVMFMEAALSQLWGIGTSSIAPSLGRLVGCILILISVSFTMFFGPEKENE
ncbi:pseudopaline exporter CntI isoform X2 [Gossypium hirsutum]|uniref:Pseudopaline exporter CntI isoform X2 n=1 Tax=Gossypium hirsutum TaxID=3635 RepID=A0A1U8P7P2_GOSHI|nr:pseudopaline exporter CntI isoform X2 [Gossypium hirsutum]